MKRVSLRFSDDLVFRAFLGSERLTKSLLGLLNAILREAIMPQIRSLTIKNPFLLETWENEKEPVLDIRVVDEEGCEYDVEMQCRREKYYVGRVMTYTFRLHVDQLKRGDEYDSLKKTIGISLTTFPIDPAQPDLWFDVWKCHSVLGTGLGYDDLVNIFVRLPSKRGEEPVGIKDPELLNWIKFLAFYPDLSDEEIVSIKESTSGVSEMLQEAEMFVGTDQEREMMQARERYWHDQASRVFEYKEQIRALTENNLSLAADNRSKDAQISSMAADNLSLAADNRSKDAKISSMAADRLKSERKLIAKMLRVRFNVPDATSLVRLNEIDASDALDKLSDYSVDCKDYDSFLQILANYNKD